MADRLRIGNGQGFWGDDVDAPMRLARSGACDVLTLDYLAEVTLSILARKRRRDPQAGWAEDFADVVAGVAPLWSAGSPLIIIANAGGLNVEACAAECRRRLAGVPGTAGLPIGLVSGDDLMPDLDQVPDIADRTQEIGTGVRLADLRGTLVSANAYLGAGPIAEVVARGARLVITGRVADPSLAVGPAIARFRPADVGRDCADWDFLAGATVAGHLIECGAQATGGIHTDWLEVPDPAAIGYPIVELARDGSCVLTKPPGTGGTVTVPVAKEQLLYELGDPTAYLSPDVTADFTTIGLAQAGPDRVDVSGARGRPHTGFYKVSAAVTDGWTATGTLTLFGRDVVEKGGACGEVIRRRLAAAGAEPAKFEVELLGTGAVAPGVLPVPADLREVVLRVGAWDPRREVVERFSRELAPLVTTGPQGTTGYIGGRPTPREVLSYRAMLVPRELMRPTLRMTTA